MKYVYFEFLSMKRPKVLLIYAKLSFAIFEVLKILNSSQIVLTTSIFDKERKKEKLEEEFSGASKLILFHNLFLTPILPAF